MVPSWHLRLLLLRELLLRLLLLRELLLLLLLLRELRQRLRLQWWLLP